MPALTLPAIAAFLSLLTGLYLLVAKDRSLQTVILALGFLACGALEVLDGLGAADPGDILFWKKSAVVVEGMLPLLWGWSGALAGRRFRQLSLATRGGLILLPGLFLAGLFLPPGQLFFSPDFGDEQLLFLKQPGYIFYLALLLFLTFALVMHERAFAGLDRNDRWHVKFEVLGVGAIVAVEILYYSQGLLYRSLDMSLVPARAAALIIGVALFAYSRLRRGRPVQLSVSRDVAYRSIVVLVVGIYLLGLGLVGEGMRYFSPSSQRAALFVMALAGGLAVTVIVLSEGLRRKTRVFLNKHFFRQKFDYRAHWLEFTRRLSRAQQPQELWRAIVEFYCQTFGLRGGALALRSTEQGDFFLVESFEWPLVKGSVAAGGQLPTFLRERKWVFNREDGDAAIVAENTSIFQEYAARFVVPLFFEEELVGMVILGPPIDSSESFNYEDYDLMKVLAFQAASVLHSQALVEQLSSTREMAAIGKVAAFVMHDLKNSVSNLALVVDNARDYMDDPEFQQDMLETLDNSVTRMKGLIERLKNFEGKMTLDCEPCDLLGLVREVVAEFPGSSIHVTGKKVVCPVDKWEVSKVVQNLILNALDATGDAGPVWLEVDHGDAPCIKCRDEGAGMSEDFMRERLFKPFETTKQKGFGIGLYQCRQIVDAHGGRIEVQSEPGRGTEFAVVFPG